MLAVPGVTSMSIVDPREESIEFDVPFRAEDAGTNMEAIFVLDYDAGEGLDLVGLPVPVDASAVPVEEQPLRNVSFSWSPVGNNRPAAGYHSLTMILTYADIIDQWDPDLLATQTWWFCFLPANGEEVTNCATAL